MYIPRQYTLHDADPWNEKIGKVNMAMATVEEIAHGTILDMGEVWNLPLNDFIPRGYYICTALKRRSDREDDRYMIDVMYGIK